MDKEMLKKEYRANFTYEDWDGIRCLYASQFEQSFEWFWHHLEKLHKENEELKRRIKELEDTIYVWRNLARSRGERLEIFYIEKDQTSKQ